MSILECQAEIDCVTKAQWSALLNHFEDANIYQTWSYGAVRWGERNLSHLLLKQDGEVIGMKRKNAFIERFRCYAFKALCVSFIVKNWQSNKHLIRFRKCE